MPKRAEPRNLLYQRAYKACFACRETKNKCIIIEDSSDSVRLQCRRCKRQHRECVFPPERYWNGSETKRSRAPTRGQQRDSSARLVRQVIEADRLSSNDTLLGFSSAESREGSEQPYTRDIHFKDPTLSRSITPFSVWNSFPGVRMGWLSAEEAMIFVNYFFQNLAPWSIVPMQRLADPIDYGILVGEEPLLAPTVLMISSRYHSLPGSSGQARANFIHNKLWERCQNLLLDIVLGQGPKGITRSIGTIEALLLMIEWHPGSLHTHGIENEDRDISQENGFDVTANSPVSPGARDREVADVIWSSGRMSWMLLGCADSLSQEIGLNHPANCAFGVLANENLVSNQASDVPWQKERFSRANLLLRILKHQIAFRQGLKLDTSPFMGYITPRGLEEDTLAQQLKIVAAWVDINQVERWVTEYHVVPNGDSQSQEPANPSRIQLVSYVDLSLAEWLSEHPEFHSYYESCIMSAIMLEYHYVRAYAYSLALPDNSIHVMSGHSRAATVQSSHNHPVSSVETITDAIVTSTTTFFQMICQLGESGELKYAPDRVFARIAGASMLLLKAVSLSSLAMPTDEYLDMLSNVARVLRENAVDPLHICIQYADLLDAQVQLHRRHHTCGQAKDIDHIFRELFHVKV